MCVGMDIQPDKVHTSVEVVRYIYTVYPLLSLCKLKSCPNLSYACM